jgi:hypothetical protein
MTVKQIFGAALGAILVLVVGVYLYSFQWNPVTRTYEAPRITFTPGTPAPAAVDPRDARIAALEARLAAGAAAPVVPGAAAPAAAPANATPYAGKTSIARNTMNLDGDVLEFTSDPCKNSKGQSGLVAKVKATGELRCAAKN